jgi:hypothetical protein
MGLTLSQKTTLKSTKKVTFHLPHLFIPLPEVPQRPFRKSFQNLLRLQRRQKKICQLSQDQPLFRQQYHRRRLWLANHQVLGLITYRKHLEQFDNSLKELPFLLQ